jgi:hypothetical protein
VTLYEDNNTTANRLVNSCQPLFETIGAQKGFWLDIQTFKAAFFQHFLTKFNVSWQSSSPHYRIQRPSRSRNKTNQETRLRLQNRWQSRSRQAGPSPDAVSERPRCGGGPSPAESVFTRPIRDGLPSHHRSFTNEWQREPEELERRMTASREKSRDFHDATAHTLAALCRKSRPHSRPRHFQMVHSGQGNRSWTKQGLLGSHRKRKRISSEPSPYPLPNPRHARNTQTSDDIHRSSARQTGHTNSKSKRHSNSSRTASTSTS